MAAMERAYRAGWLWSLAGYSRATLFGVSRKPMSLARIIWY